MRRLATEKPLAAPRTVMLDAFQHPAPVAWRAQTWTLKQVEDDEGRVARADAGECVTDAGARVGGMIGDNVLLYGKVGYTSFRETNRLTPVAGGGTIVVHPEFDGLRLGAGTEIAVGARTFIKAEYRFSNYEASDSFDKHQGVIGFGLRF